MGRLSAEILAQNTLSNLCRRLLCNGLSLTSSKSQGWFHEDRDGTSKSQGGLGMVACNDGSSAAGPKTGAASFTPRFHESDSQDGRAAVSPCLCGDSR